MNLEEYSGRIYSELVNKGLSKEVSENEARKAVEFVKEDGARVSLSQTYLDWKIKAILQEQGGKIK